MNSLKQSIQKFVAGILHSKPLLLAFTLVSANAAMAASSPHAGNPPHTKVHRYGYHGLLSRHAGRHARVHSAEPKITPTLASMSAALRTRKIVWAEDIAKARENIPYTQSQKKSQ